MSTERTVEHTIERTHDSGEQRVVIQNSLIEIRLHLDKQDRALEKQDKAQEVLLEKFQKLAQELIGKPVNGEAINNEGGWCGRMSTRVSENEKGLEEVKTWVGDLKLTALTRATAWSMFLGGTVIIALFVAIGTYLVWAHKG